MRNASIASVVVLLPLALSAAEAVPDSLAPPAGLKRLLDASAVGVQIYRCAPPKGAEGKAAAVWNFEAPRARLTDQRGQPAGSAPPGTCAHLDEVLEVPYRAMYVFWVQPAEAR